MDKDSIQKCREVIKDHYLISNTPTPHTSKEIKDALQTCLTILDEYPKLQSDLADAHDLNTSQAKKIAELTESNKSFIEHHEAQTKDFEAERDKLKEENKILRYGTDERVQEILRLKEALKKIAKFKSSCKNNEHIDDIEEMVDIAKQCLDQLEGR